jgi:hypothetical protein
MLSFFEADNNNVSNPRQVPQTGKTPFLFFILA